ncbi:hypothetical protein EMIHUDRAFT_204730 [Emiliania huxleyi CCMP1516]|uniref:indole-3-glycerol-phosphate synthase n=2 Tax=Emiliania huxleyi TaxID=2903 RepID=A0A0D3JW85_EMIH1|nr:hypothetical protein EMIHUDRAFT_204730 [Emiliania huxleyi CCMP1516]EOD27770.1 hypothetical protein EMIHUDRAFT_204730 [Emiliania huxleyi CCMP1516]|eukprot:XP_005780199.1 hypothetical protein EMIHUDRAFT_204730 [Emiliania huxleyi CCMP1516]
MARCFLLTAFALAGAASYQTLRGPGPRVAEGLRRPAPLLRVEQHESAEEDDDAELARMAGDFAPPSAAVKDKLHKAIKKPKGSMALIGEGSPQLSSATLGGFDLNDPAYLSEQFRIGGCSGVSVRSGERQLAADALRRTSEEQQVAQGEFPGPLPVLAHLDVVDEVQLAQAAADGASAATLSLQLNGAEGTKALMEAAAGYGLESAVRVANAEEVATALSLGAKLLCIGDCSLPQAGELVAELPKDVRSICDVRVRDARDLGFDALIVSDALIEVCIRDRVPPDAVIKAMLAKGSVKYGLGMQKGRLEGAKEQLGSLAM